MVSVCTAILFLQQLHGSNERRRRHSSAEGDPIGWRPADAGKV